jgi:hypothetical protein
MFEKYRKSFLPITLIAGSFLGALAPAGFATADDHGEGGPSPYLVGHWKLNDVFSDFTGSGTPISTQNTEFVFLNPTNLTLTLEYAFFATDDTVPSTVKIKPTLFCGCDRDTLNHNGRTRYTMLAEQQGGQFSTAGCTRSDKSIATDGIMKTIVFTRTNPDGTVKIDDAVQTGYQIDVLGQVTGTSGAVTIAAEAGLAALAINDETKAEIQSIHKACNAFIKSAATPRRSK